MEHVKPFGVSDATQAKLEAVLREVEVELEPIPVERRGEFLNEMRAHLYAMLAARISDGLTEEVAWKNTQRAFGEGAEIGRDLAIEWRHKPRVETQGAPLSRRDKTLLLARQLLTMVMMLAAIIYGMPLLRAHGLESTGFLLVALVLISIGLRNEQRNKVHWTPTAKWSMALAYGHIGITWLNMVFGSGAGHGGFKALYSCWNLVFLVGTILLVLRIRREMNTRRPWQALPRYAQSPVAAEQEYRVNPVIGMALGVVAVGIIALNVGGQFFGAWTGVGVGAIVLTLGVSVVRWLR